MVRIALVILCIFLAYELLTAAGVLVGGTISHHTQVGRGTPEQAELAVRTGFEKGMEKIRDYGIYIPGLSRIIGEPSRTSAAQRDAAAVDLLQPSLFKEDAGALITIPDDPIAADAAR